MPYDSNGDPVDPRDVLDAQELAEYAAARRIKGGRRYRVSEGSVEQAEREYEASLDDPWGGAA